MDIFSLSGQLISLSSFWLESKLAIGPSPQSSSAYADGLPEAYCCPYSGRTPALCVSFLPMNSARVRHWQSTWDTKQRTNASYHIGEPQKKKKMLSKRNQTQNTTYCITIYIRYPSFPPKIYTYISAGTNQLFPGAGREDLKYQVRDLLGR